MFPIDEAAIWTRRNEVLFLRANRPNTMEHRIAEELSGDDVPKLLDALVQVYGDLLSERNAIDERWYDNYETRGATNNEVIAAGWTRVLSGHGPGRLVRS